MLNAFTAGACAKAALDALASGWAVAGCVALSFAIVNFVAAFGFGKGRTQ